MLFRFVGRVCLSAVLAVVALTFVAGPASAAGLVRRGPAPTWVTSAAIPQMRPERARQASSGLYFLLIEDQNRPGVPDVRYSRSVYKVTERSGLEDGARFNVTFDPTTEDVIIHHIRVWRAGVVQDRLRDVSVQVLRRESELDDGIFTGLKTAHLELKDVRVGDIVDYAYSLERRDPLLLGTYASDVTTGWPVPLALTRFRLLWPHGQPITIKTFVGAPQPRMTPGPDRDEYLWEIVDEPPRHEESSVPEWRDQWGRIAISSMTSWSQAAAWSLPMYPATDPPLPAAWTARIDEIVRRFPNPRDRVTEALRMVQDDVRYVSLAMGAGSFRPRLPTEVIRSGYGDCKDKTLLLVTVLHRMRISAAPALTSMDRGPGLPGEPPGTGAFDHVIVRIEMDGKVWWVDPTASQEGGRFPALAGLPYGWALPIRRGQDRLEAIPKPTAPTPTMEVEERYELPKGADRDLKLTVVST